MNTPIRSCLVLAALLLLPAAATAQGAQATLGLGGHYAYVENRDTDHKMNGYGGMIRLRSKLLGFEGSIDYRNEDLPAGAALKSWPATVSLMIYPVESIYLLGGLGSYNSTIEFPVEFGLPDQSETTLGYHVGAGIEVPVARAFRVTGDLRYQWVHYDFHAIPEAIGNVESDGYTVRVGGLLSFR